MALTTVQQIMFQNLSLRSSSKQAVPLSQDDIAYLIRRTAADLRVLKRMKTIKGATPNFFVVDEIPPDQSNETTETQFAELVAVAPDADVYVSCLAAMMKGRMKYQRVLETQPFAHMDQVGPRGLLQYGLVATEALAPLLVWRKWVFDIDNRVAQDTGYFVEPVLTGAIGGVPAPGKKSPVKRHKDASKGRQVDCIKGKRAYEFKLRITIAASGQGRWGEELDFAADCRASGYTPVLLVLDPTVSTKLTKLIAAFEGAGGECFTGQDAWTHLKAEASAPMVHFIENYVEKPLKEIYSAQVEEGQLPCFSLAQEGSNIRFTVGATSWVVERGEPDPNLAHFDPVQDHATDSVTGL
jgi:hypothetical protein